MKHRGYTAVEVLLSMTVLSVGAAGVISMQKSAIQGNSDARMLDTANAIAQTWMDRLRTDATAWTLPSTVIGGAATTNINNTTWLQNYGSPVGVPFLPAAPAAYPAEGLSSAFDAFGRDLALGDAATATFCTHVRIDTLQYDSSANPLILSATVLVFWPKQLINSAAPSTHNCTSWFDVAAYEATNPGTYHITYVNSAIRKTPLQ